MGKIIGLFGQSGEGKTTSMIINPDGSFDPKNYQGLNPDHFFYINTDLKSVPFPVGYWEDKRKNYLATNDFALIAKALKYAAGNKEIKGVIIDTLNLYLAYKEFNDRKKLTFDQWRDIANDIIELNVLCTSTLRDDQIAYILGHVENITDVDGKEKKVLSVIGKKSKRTPPEAFYPVVLMTRLESDGDGNNKFYFQTRAAVSSAKTPIGMFEDFEIPNSLALVDATVRKYYQIN